MVAGESVCRHVLLANSISHGPWNHFLWWNPIPKQSQTSNAPNKRSRKWIDRKQTMITLYQFILLGGYQPIWININHEAFGRLYLFYFFGHHHQSTLPWLPATLLEFDPKGVAAWKSGRGQDSSDDMNSKRQGYARHLFWADGDDGDASFMRLSHIEIVVIHKTIRVTQW